jgi:hypothetical protein
MNNITQTAAPLPVVTMLSEVPLATYRDREKVESRSEAFWADFALFCPIPKTRSDQALC